MKKFFTLLMGLLLVSSVSAQDEQETAEYPKWTLTVKRTDVEPNGDGDVYTMNLSGAKSNGADVYTVTVPLDVKGNDIKPAKYWFTVNYDDGNGTVLSLSQKNSYLLYKNDDIEKLTVGAYVNSKNQLQAVFSVFNYVLGDANWRIMTQFPCPLDGSTSTVYYNDGFGADRKALQNISATSTDTCLAAGSSVSGPLIQGPAKAAGIYRAVFDYSTTIITVEKTNTLPVALNPNEATPFVCAANVAIPAGVNVYTLKASDYADGRVVAYPFEEDSILANTPVLLKAEVGGTYNFDIRSATEYIVMTDSVYSKGKLTLMKHIEDTKVEGNLLVGVHQPHYLPDNCYAISGDMFVRGALADQHIMNQFTAYIALPEGSDAPETIQIEYYTPTIPVEDVLYLHFTDAEGNYVASHEEVLNKDEDGTYSIVIKLPAKDGKEKEYFVLSDATKSAEEVASRAADATWASLGNVYHAADESGTLAKYEAGEANPTPIVVPAGYKYALKADIADPENSSLNIVNQGTTTGIENVSCEATQADNRTYNIFGIEVDENYRGLVIRNGKKLLVR